MKLSLCPLGVAAFLMAGHGVSPARAGAGTPGPSAPQASPLGDLDDASVCLPLDEGRLAVATGGGLALVDDKGRVRALTSLDGLPETRIHALAAAGRSLWVGTERGAALVTLEPRLGVARVVADDVPVRAVLSTAGGTYLGTWGRGLLWIAPGPSLEDGAVGRVPATEVRGTARGTRVAALAEHQGSVYVAFADGPPAKLENGALREVAPEPANGQALLSTGTGDTARLLLGDLSGLFRLSDRATSIASVDVRALASNGPEVLVGTYGSGLLVGSERGAFRSGPRIGRFVRGVAVRGSVRCVATTDGVFVSTADEPDREQANEPARSQAHGWRKVRLGGPPSNDVTALAVAGDGADQRVVVGTFDRGAAIHEAGEFRPVKGLEVNETVNAAAWQGRGAGAILWLGTARGLVRVRPDGPHAGVRRFGSADGLPSSVVRAVLVLPDDRLLVGTDEGPAVLDGDRVTPLAEVPRKRGLRTLDSPMRATWALAQGSDGTLWVGTNAGLYYGKDGRFRRASVATGELPDDWVTAIALQGPDVFVGTYSGGVTRLRREEAREGDGAPSHLVSVSLGGGYVNAAGLTVRDGELYAATMDGLLVRPVGDVGTTWETASRASPGRDVTAIAAAGDVFWVASRRGLALAPIASLHSPR